MIVPSPAIVSKAGARRLPRLALVLLCLAYGLSGFVGRDAWKSADMAGLGLMAELASGGTSWWAPTLAGFAPEEPALLPYWLGAWALQIAPAWIAPDFAARLPFMVMLALVMAGTWYGTYYLARTPLAQPVAFAFGGEAKPADYARAIADGALLALLACLGLAQLAHETTPALAQLGFAALLFFSAAALPFKARTAGWSASVALAGLALAGAPSLAFLWGAGAAVIHLVSGPADADARSELRGSSMVVFVGCLLVLGLSHSLDLLRWKVEVPTLQTVWSGHVELLIWFTWPAWPLTLWTLWRWRRHLHSRHLALPLWFVVVAVGAALSSPTPDRSLLLALPALACLAAFALPTLQRQVSALIDWFTLLFFSGCAFTVWVVWIAMQTGVPAQPAANVQRLAPGFEPHLSVGVLALAIVATLAWAWLVRWRVGRHQPAIWTSLVLPAGGVTLSFFLAMSLWMPLLNYAQSYRLLVQRTLNHLPDATCVEIIGLGLGQIAAFRFYGQLPLQPLSAQAPQCPWLLAEPRPDGSMPAELNAVLWDEPLLIRHPANAGESVLVLKRSLQQP